MATVTLLEKINTISNPRTSDLTFLKDEIAVAIFSVVNDPNATSGDLFVKQETSPQNQFVEVVDQTNSYLRTGVFYLKMTANYTGKFLFQWLDTNGFSLGPDRSFFYIYKISSNSGDLSYASSSVLSSNSSTTPSLTIPTTGFNDVIIAGGSMLTFFQNNEYITDTDTTDGSWSAVEHLEDTSHPRPNTFTQYKITTGASQQSYGGTITNPYNTILASAVFRETGGPYWGISA